MKKTAETTKIEGHYVEEALTVNPEPNNKLIALLDKSGMAKDRILAMRREFMEYVTIATEWEKKAKTIVVTEETQTELMEEARRGRLQCRNTRTAIESKRKELKESSLKEGRAIDAVAKFLTDLITPAEKHLETQETYKARKEAERLAEKKRIRTEALAPYGTLPVFPIETLTDEAWEQLLADQKLLHETKTKAAEEAEKKRLADEQAANEARAIVDIEHMAAPTTPAPSIPPGTTVHIPTRTKTVAAELSKDRLLEWVKGTADYGVRTAPAYSLTPEVEQIREAITQKLQGFKAWATAQISTLQ